MRVNVPNRSGRQRFGARAGSSARRGSLSVAGALLLGAVGCQREAPLPTERMAPVLTDGPLIGEVVDGKGAPYAMRAGELVFVTKSYPAKAWKGKMVGVPAQRDGVVVHIKRAPGDELLFGWKSDLGDEIDVPTSSWICDKIAHFPGLPAPTSPAQCTDAVRRARLDGGAIAAFIECSSGPCPVALVRGGKLSAIAVEGITTARPITVEGRVMLLAETRWSRNEGAWTGGRLVPIAFGGDAPAPLAAIDVDEQDARDPVKSVSRIATMKIDASAKEPTVRVVGERTETERATGNVVARAPVDETWVITPAGARPSP